MPFFFSKRGEITIDDLDCADPTTDSEILIVCDPAEVDAALEQGRLTPEQACWLHQQQESWEIRVDAGRKGGRR